LATPTGTRRCGVQSACLARLIAARHRHLTVSPQAARFSRLLGMPAAKTGVFAARDTNPRLSKSHANACCTETQAQTRKDTEMPRPVKPFVREPSCRQVVHMLPPAMANKYIHEAKRHHNVFACPVPRATF
jgi:hypothetical protein